MTAQSGKINLQRLLDERLKDRGDTKLLVHCCCAACSTYCLEYLAERVRNITLYYCNPNIDSEREYELRAAELARFNSKAGYDFPLIVEPYAPAAFYEAVRGAESTGEGGERCRRCFKLRLSRAVKKAEELSCDAVLTTLSVSPHKDAALLYQTGLACAGGGVEFLPSDFKKDGGFVKSAGLCARYNVYRQDYCGCVFSKAERAAAKESRP